MGALCRWSSLILSLPMMCIFKLYTNFWRTILQECQITRWSGIQMFPEIWSVHVPPISDVWWGACTYFQVIVFCATGMVTSLMYLFFREMQLNVREIHSRKAQLYRTRIVDEFKQSKRLILISSDVSSRGINYPDVTLVIQVCFN